MRKSIYDSKTGYIIRTPINNTKNTNNLEMKHYCHKNDLESRAANNHYTPVQIAKIYDFPPSINNMVNPPSRTNIAIIELGGGYDLKDLNTYWSYLGFQTLPQVVPISVDGAQNQQGSDADYEVVLDIEVVGGINPSSNIYVYFAHNTMESFYNAIQAAVYDTVHNPSIISISWGAPEKQWAQSDINRFNDLFKKATEKGINICCASGDNGSSDGIPGLNVDFPGSSPYVLSCGGTTLVCPTSQYKDSTTKESVWNNTSGAGGGGYSATIPAPSYQSGLGFSKRGVPDVSGVADPYTGWIIYIKGKYQVIGGTSAVAPMWAGYLSLLNIKKFINPLLYPKQSGFHDIVIGNNGQYTSINGWDPASGLGSPNGAILNKLLSS